MDPRFHTGDLAVLRPADRYDVGDVVASAAHCCTRWGDAPDRRCQGGRYTFKGDNNSWLDPEQPPTSDMIASSRFGSPGWPWLERIASPTALSICAILLLAGGGTGP